MGTYVNGGVYLMDQGGLSYGEVRSFQRKAIFDMASTLVHRLTDGEACVRIDDHDTITGHYVIRIEVEREPDDHFTIAWVPVTCDVHLGLAHDAIMSAVKCAIAAGSVRKDSAEPTRTP